MKVKWCWRCKVEVPMLNEQEFALCRKAMRLGRPFIREEIQKRGIKNHQWLDKGSCGKAITRKNQLLN